MLLKMRWVCLVFISLVSQVITTDGAWSARTCREKGCCVNCCTELKTKLGTQLPVCESKCADGCYLGAGLCPFDPSCSLGGDFVTFGAGVFPTPRSTELTITCDAGGGILCEGQDCTLVTFPTSSPFSAPLATSAPCVTPLQAQLPHLFLRICQP